MTLWSHHDGAQIALRPTHPRRDLRRWSDLRAANQSWTGPWDSTNPHPSTPVSFKRTVKDQNAEARAGRLLPWVLTVDGAIAGQVHVFSIVRGAQQGGTIGYWIAQRFAGRAITPVAVAMAADHSFDTERLHRLEVNIRPENANSLRVVEKLGFRDEGLRRSFLHIDGGWRDHRTFALTADERGGAPLLERVARH